MTQTPALQRGVAPPQLSPHVPQLLLLVWRSTQLPTPPPPPAHCVYPGSHAHVPLMHAAPPGQLVPHAPQLRLFD